MTPQAFYRMFKKYGIKHKVKSEYIKDYVLNDKGSNAYLARKYKVNIGTIKKIRKDDKNDHLEHTKNI